MLRISNLIDKSVDFLFMLVMSVASTALLPAIYFIKSSYSVIDFGVKCSMLINFVLYIATAVLLSLFSLYLMGRRASDSINNEVSEIKPVNNDYLPIYVGYIFVSLSLPNPAPGQVDIFFLVLIYVMICLFVTCSKSLCFNPLFVIFGYGYYLVNTTSNTKVFVITKQKIGKGSKRITFPNLTKINEIVFLDKDK